MSLTENSNQVFLPGGATNSQNSPYISVWPLDHIYIFTWYFKDTALCKFARVNFNKHCLSFFG